MDIMATADTRVFPSSPSLSEQLSTAKNMIPTADTTQAFLIQEQLSLREDLAQEQGQMMDSPSYVCEWMSTNLLLPPKDHAAEGGQNIIYLCLPVHLSEASYFKQNEEKEECKDDGYCHTTATQLRLMQLDRYLAAVAPLASSTQRLLLGDPITATQSNHGSIQHVDHQSLNKRRRRSKYERQSQLPTHQRSPPHHRLITSTNCGRVINVLQGEIAHCTPSQADTLVSDDATTCHIVALWSHYSSSEGGEETSNNVLATMTHIDGPGYETSIRDAVNEHIKYHSMHSKQNMNDDSEESKESFVGGIVELSIHIMGGFNDNEGSSIEITDNVLQTFAALSNAYSISRVHPRIRMTLETCAVASCNDNGTGCPLGRGLAMEVATGNIFLAEVEDVVPHLESLHMPPSAVVAYSNGIGMVAVDGDVQLFNARENNDTSISALGPEITLRSVRLWASAFHSHARKRENRLNVIHLPNRDYLCIEPFYFGPHQSAKSLLGCTDEELLPLTSTSPEVENNNFIPHVRESLTYMNETKSSRVFMFGLPLKFRRVGLNGWALSS